MKNKQGTPNGIYVKNTILDMLEKGKSRDEIVDYFFEAGNKGHFLWGSTPKETIEKSVDEIIELNNKPKSYNKPFLLRWIYVFSIWLGFGMILHSELIKNLNWQTIAMISGFVISLIFSLILINEKTK